MSPSSLIFVAVIAIWATYLVVHVARRREYVATARTVDRFSSQMRVLQRRAVTSTPVAERGCSSSASLTRPRPLAARSEIALSAPAAPAVEASPVTAATPATPVSVAPEAEATDETPAAPARTGLGRRVRTAALVLALVAMIVTGVLAGLGTLGWVVPAAGAALVAALLVASRRAAVAERAAKRREAAARRFAAAREERRAREDALEARPNAPELPVAQEYVPSRPVDPLEVAGLVGAPATDAEPAAAGPDPLHGTPAWDPAPVPPPTYTLKARADRPMPEPLDVPVPIETEDDHVAWDEYRGRDRVVNG